MVTFVPQMAVADLNAEELPSYHRNVDNDESVFVHADADGGRGADMLSHVPQGILHGADEAARAAFNQRRVAGHAAHVHRHERRHRSAAGGVAGVSAVKPVNLVACRSGWWARQGLNL